MNIDWLTVTIWLTLTFLILGVFMFGMAAGLLIAMLRGE